MGEGVSKTAKKIPTSFMDGPMRLRGHSYVDQILPNFDPLFHSSGQLWTFYRIPTLCHVTKLGFFPLFLTT